MLTVFSKSVLLRTKGSFNKSEAIALQVQFALQFGLIDVTLHLRSPLHCRVSFTTFGLITSGSGPLSDVHHSSMLLVISMTVAGRHMWYADSPYKNLLCYHRGSQPFFDHVALEYFDR